MTCTVCGKKAYSDRCVAHKVRKPIASSGLTYVRTKPLKRTRIKLTMAAEVRQRAWMATREKWFAAHPATAYQCHYCNRRMVKEAVTLDHKIPRSRAPELKHELSNLVPACFTCNMLKGSVAHDEYAHVCH